jgi:hypothetical protein
MRFWAGARGSSIAWSLGSDRAGQTCSNSAMDDLQIIVQERRSWRARRWSRSLAASSA